MSLLFSQITNYWTRAQYFHAQCHASEPRGFGDLPAPISSGTHIHATERSLKDYWKYLPETKARCLAILTKSNIRLGGGPTISRSSVCTTFSRSFQKKGYIGLAPEYAVPGDMICMIFGAKVPFVLRKAPEKWFELAGETYVYGIMMEKQWI